MYETIIVFSFVIFAVFYEWRIGKYTAGKKNLVDWQIGILCAAAIALVQRPIVKTTVLFLAAAFLPENLRNLQSIEVKYPIMCLIFFIMTEELLHGAGHRFSHTKTPKNKALKFLHNLYRTAHRPHHLVGNNDGKGELSVTQTFVEGWTFWFIMPNIWFSFIMLSMGFVQTFLIAMTFKGLWSVHVHSNFNYDLYLLNHPNKYISKGFYALAHVFTFPNTHRHHHSRGQNSAKNMHNLLSLYDWLIYGTLSIEKERPKIIGWKQNEKEEHSAWYRFTRTTTTR